MQPASIIIPTLNEELYLPVLLASLQKVGEEVDIIVVDGASTDTTIEVAKQFIPAFPAPSSLRIIEGKERGISLQRNRGAAVARYDLLIFCDADVLFPSKDVYGAIVSEFAEKNYVVAAPVLYAIEPGLNFKILYGLIHHLQKLFLIFGRPYFAGSCLLTTKEIFTRIGGFDTAVLLGEDVDYALKAAKLGRSNLLKTHLPVSARRGITYGYNWLYKEIPNVIRFFITGRINADTIYYPFGGYGGEESHHVTNNKGKETRASISK